MHSAPGPAAIAAPVTAVAVAAAAAPAATAATFHGTSGLLWPRCNPGNVKCSCDWAKTFQKLGVPGIGEFSYTNIPERPLPLPLSW